MEIDPLKPKNIPLSADTILWFEFLLDPKLLTIHLENSISEPSPIELISQFLSIAREIPIELTFPEIELQPEVFKFNRKQLALKILTLKIVSHLKWNLDILEKQLSIRRQVQILSDLCSIAAGRVVNLPLSLVEECVIGKEGSKQALNFALTLCHLWTVRVPVVRADRVKYNLIITQNMNEHIRDDFFIDAFLGCTQTSIDFLTRLCFDDEPFKILTYDTFVALDDNSELLTQNFDAAIEISHAEIRTQIHFDLCSYYLHIKKYDLAKYNALECKKNFQLLKFEYENKNKQNIDDEEKPFIFCNITENMLYGLLLACGIEKKQPGLLQKLTESCFNKFNNIIPILQEDNLVKEVPIINRLIVELDSQTGILLNTTGNNKNLSTQIVALNTIRCIIDNGDIIPHVDFLQKFNCDLKDFAILIQAAEDVLPSCTLKDKMKIKQYFLNVLLTVEKNINQFETKIKTLNLFTNIELDDIRRQKSDMDIEFPSIAFQTDWKFTEIKSTHVERAHLERQLVACYTGNGIRNCLVKLAELNPTRPLRSISRSWTSPIPFQSVIMSLQEGFLQDFAYILVGKAKELRMKKEFSGALLLLTTLKNELQRPEIPFNPNIIKLSKLVAWEILLYQIYQTLEEYPNKALDDETFIKKCTECLASLQNGDDIIPRMTILENCATLLLNLTDWKYAIFLDKRCPLMELTTSFALIGLDKDKFKGNSKKCRDAWDLVLSMFCTIPMKRSNHTTSSSSASRDSPTIMNYSILTSFLSRLRESYVLGLVISLLAKLYNVLKDDTNLDLNADYMFMWPNSISNAKAYNIDLVSETLNNLIQQGLKYHPRLTAWVKLKGDLEFVNGNYESAMKYYVNSIISVTDFCTLLHKNQSYDDFLIRRMIKCSSNLGCYMQAAVLCQFLSEIDYGLAFKSISEKTANFSDAMDAYYTCIWDSTLMEFIVNLHNKKGEHTRKLQAISYMGQLELNANNNDEIKHEAAAIRKSHFLQALAKQYLS